MNGCSEQVFNGITQSRWDCIKQAIQARMGVAISTDSGTTSKSSFNMRWNFDPLTQILTIQCTDKPFIIPCSAIESTVTAIVNGCP
jgi:hypothetical protein